MQKYHEPLVTTTVKLPVRQMDQLGKLETILSLAKEQNVTKSDLIREAVEDYLKLHKFDLNPRKVEHPEAEA